MGQTYEARITSTANKGTFPDCPFVFFHESPNCFLFLRSKTLYMEESENIQLKNLLRAELEQKLMTECPGNELGNINYKHSALEIEIIAKQKLQDSINDFKNLDKNDGRIEELRLCLEQIEKVWNYKKDESISHTTIRTFLNGQIKKTSLRVLHILSLYLGYVGWFDFRAKTKSVVGYHIADNATATNKLEEN